MSEPLESVRVEAKDFLGNSIEVNDTIIYPVRRGSSMWMKKLKVLAVRSTANGVRVSGTNESGHPVSIQNVHNCTVVTKCLRKEKEES
jgi:hypothetical protein